MTRSDIGTELMCGILKPKFEILEDIAFRVIEERAKAVKVKKAKEEEEEKKEHLNR